MQLVVPKQVIRLATQKHSRVRSLYRCTSFATKRRLLSTTPADPSPSKVKSTLSQSSSPSKNNDDDDSYAQDAAKYDSYIDTVQSTAHSVQSSMFSFTSGRTQRRRKQQERRRAIQKKRREREDNMHIESLPPDEPDNRTIRDLIFPNPFQGMDVPQPKPWPNTFRQWRIIVVEAWKDYRWTWRGFMANPGFIVVDPLDEKDTTNGEKMDKADTMKDKDAIVDSTKSIEDNVQRNTDFLKEEAQSVKTQFQDATGIHTMEDAKAWAARGLQLATECVSEFMQGYRKGRDEEVENMLTKYWQDLQTTVGINTETRGEEEGVEGKRRRRKVRRRVRNRLHATLLQARS